MEWIKWVIISIQSKGILNWTFDNSNCWLTWATFLVDGPLFLATCFGRWRGDSVYTGKLCASYMWVLYGWRTNHLNALAIPHLSSKPLYPLIFSSISHTLTKRPNRTKHQGLGQQKWDYLEIDLVSTVFGRILWPVFCVFFSKTTPKTASFSGSMQLLAGVKLCTGRPITNHPHYEDKGLRKRTKEVLSVSVNVRISVADPRFFMGRTWRNRFWQNFPKNPQNKVECP